MGSLRVTLLVLLLGVVSTGTDPEAGLTNDQSFDVPFADFKPWIFDLCPADVELVLMPLLQIGCEAGDCCPGCVTDGPLELRIRASGVLLEFFSLHLENGRGNSLAFVETTGNAEIISDSSFQVRPGGSTLQISDVTAFDGVSFRPELRLDPLATRGFGIQQTTNAILTVEQLLGGVVVGEYALVIRLWPCPRPTDRVDLEFNRGMDRAVVATDGRRPRFFLGSNPGPAICTNDWGSRGRDIVNVGSLLHHGDCHSEVVVFSDEDAVAVFEHVPVWTDPADDVFYAFLDHPSWDFPVTLWTPAGLADQASMDLNIAEAIFYVSHAGITFESHVLTVVNGLNETEIENVVEDVDQQNNCNFVINLPGEVYTPGRLNIYFVDYLNGTFKGFACRDHGAVFIGATTNATTTLAHELGHVFSLWHVGTSFTQSNVMHGGAAGSDFTEGQGFTMSVNDASLLNVWGVRTAGPVRDCSTHPPINPIECMSIEWNRDPN